ncbi:MAG: class III signal peptide-containing protein [Candidatus Diapherotrites archaeon]
MDSKGQVSFEYLLMVLFAVIMVMAATVIAFNLQIVSGKAKEMMITERDGTISSLMQSS